MNWTARTETFDGARDKAPHDEPHDWSELKFNLVVSEVAPHQMTLLREELDALVEWLRRGVGEPPAAKTAEPPPPPPPVPEWANRIWVDPATGASYVTAPAVGPCDHKGGAVYWNEFNSTFQCHQCGEVAKFATPEPPQPTGTIPESAPTVGVTVDGVPYVPAPIAFQWEPGEGDVKDTLLREFGEAPAEAAPPADDGEALRAAVAAALASAPVEAPAAATADDPAPPLPTHVGAMKDRLRASATLVSERYDDPDDLEAP